MCKVFYICFYSRFLPWELSVFDFKPKTILVNWVDAALHEHGSCLTGPAGFCSLTLGAMIVEGPLALLDFLYTGHSSL